MRLLKMMMGGLCVDQEDSNQSFASAVMTPVPSRSAELAAATPSSPLLSLLLSSTSKPFAVDAADSSPVKSAEQIAPSSAVLASEDIKEVRTVYVVHLCHNCSDIWKNWETLYALFSDSSTCFDRGK